MAVVLDDQSEVGPAPPRVRPRTAPRAGIEVDDATRSPTWGDADHIAQRGSNKVIIYDTIEAIH